MSRLRSLIALLALALLVGASDAAAHPMGNFSVSRYSRLEALPDRIAINYALDLAEIPSVEERRRFDADGNGKISEPERQRYLRARSAELRDGLELRVDGARVPLAVEAAGCELRPGAGGLETLFFAMDLSAPLPGGAGLARAIHYRDRNLPDQTGWKEIIAVAGRGVSLRDTTVPSVDQSQGLTVYPVAAGLVPPQVVEASFTAVPGTDGPGSAAAAARPPAAVARSSPLGSRTPRDAFTESIAAKTLTPGWVLLSLAIAFIWGAFHALSPGHGKTLVAAYLVGSRGTTKHALFLGAVVTLTHTIGVFALGMVALVAQAYVAPEKLYPILTAASGAAVAVIGFTLLRQRLVGLAAARHGLGHGHHHHDHVHSATAHEAPHDHHHDHHHSHDHDHLESHAHGHSHGPGEPYHDHLPPADAPVTWKTLLALGITGGAVPCPSALVVLLSAISLHRVGFGLVLILLFSLGLASVLTGIGLLFVHTGRLLRQPRVPGAVWHWLPVGSALVVTAIGLGILAQAPAQAGLDGAALLRSPIVLGTILLAAVAAGAALIASWRDGLHHARRC
jgi:ABC-type nickel/cobalt efflux system permease component RcnA